MSSLKLSTTENNRIFFEMLNVYSIFCTDKRDFNPTVLEFQQICKNFKKNRRKVSSACDILFHFNLKSTFSVVKGRLVATSRLRMRLLHCSVISEFEIAKHCVFSE